jgi:glycosyltransferase involved in cell wall biosynthesis
MNEPPQPDSRPRLLLLIPHLGGGGAEQVTALLARGLSPEKYDLHLALITQAADVPEVTSSKLPSWVTVHALGATRVRSAALPLLRLLRKVRPHLILSSMFHLNFLMLLLRPLLGFPIRILIRQNGTASSALPGLPRYNRLLYRLLYRRADCVLCQSAAMARDLCESFAIPERRIKVLPNPIAFDALNSTNPAAPEDWPDSGPHLFAVGRLSHEKGFDLLLESLSVVRSQFPSADLLIAGSGREESALKARCSELSLNQAVRFLGHVAAPSAWFPAATVFVLSSRHEGLPNALLEAAAAGLPIVTTPASEGLVELVGQQPGVWLARAPTAQTLADTLITALRVIKPGQRLPHAFVEPFRLNAAVAAWEELIDSFLADTGATGLPAHPNPSPAHLETAGRL